MRLSANGQPNTSFDSSTDIAFLGLEVLHFVLLDIMSLGETAVVLHSPEAIAFLDLVAAEPRFVRSLCSTLMAEGKVNLKVESDGNLEDFDAQKQFGSPLALCDKECAGKTSAHEAAASLLFNVSVYACAIESHRSDQFWKTALLRDMPGVEETEGRRSSATFCATFLRLLTDEYAGFLPTNHTHLQDFKNLTRPLVRYRLLEALRDSMIALTSKTVMGDTAVDEYMLSLLVAFNIPYICLSVWKDRCTEC